VAEAVETQPVQMELLELLILVAEVVQQLEIAVAELVLAVLAVQGL
jgi:hypothetical protein